MSKNLSKTQNFITSRLQIGDQAAYTLSDTGATHSFITKSLATKAGLPVETIPASFRIKTPMGSVVITKEIIRNCSLKIQEHATTADLIVLEMNKYDVILGMSWLTQTKAVVDCRKKTVSFTNLEGRKVGFIGESAVVRKFELYSFELIEDKEEGIGGYAGNAEDDK